MKTSFEWDENKNKENILKHKVSFRVAQSAFKDKKIVIAEDREHSEDEKRFYGFGKVKTRILTVRFTYRNNRIRIIGAGFGRKGRKIYKQSLKLTL
jgi:uncharacterized protein